MHASYFQELYATFNHQAQFLLVYISEAHSRDEWPIGSKISFCDQPKILQERCLLAEKFQKENQLTVPMAVDTMENDFDRVFSAWPVRSFVIKENKLVFKAQPDPEFYGYDFGCLEQWLKENC